ncbi:alpha/beta hydrolase [Sphingomonas sp. 28-63-12]|uniref:alpha/beta hydrolase n=1 Tax=Sphingomonas sp. 28-63-12 TaxID=1970434 RepID=UPI000BCDAF93|nr:MAG: alpha/beta hydrolase [Sphingomonas sp. 28-63-12]
MRLSIVLAVAVVAACSPSVPAAGGASPAGNAGADVPTAKADVPISLKAADGVTVYGTLYAAAHPKAVILLFHQAGSGKGEYATIAPRLVALGYSALAIDQRSGGDLFGPNQTAAAVIGQASYLDAKADLQAALDWAKPQGKPVLLWGSSYSSALVFLVAAENPGAVAALLSFSPGEYLGQPDLVSRNAAKLTIPVFVTSAKDAGEIAAARAIVDAVPGTGNIAAVPAIAGVHGSSTLIPARNPRGAEDNWRAVTAFLHQVAP